MLLALAALALLALVPASAAADGLPGTGIVPSPLSAPRGDVEYVAKRAKRDTVLREQRPATAGRFCALSTSAAGTPSRPWPTTGRRAVSPPTAARSC